MHPGVYKVKLKGNIRHFWMKQSWQKTLLGDWKGKAGRVNPHRIQSSSHWGDLHIPTQGLALESWTHALEVWLRVEKCLFGLAFTHLSHLQQSSNSEPCMGLRRAESWCCSLSSTRRAGNPGPQGSLSVCCCWAYRVRRANKQRELSQMKAPKKRNRIRRKKVWHYWIPDKKKRPKQWFPNCRPVGTTSPVSSAPFFLPLQIVGTVFPTSVPWLSLPRGCSIPTLKHYCFGWVTTEQNWTIVKCGQTQTEIFSHMFSSNHVFFQNLGRCHKATENNAFLTKVRPSSSMPVIAVYSWEAHKTCRSHRNSF